MKNLTTPEGADCMTRDNSSKCLALTAWALILATIAVFGIFSVAKAQDAINLNGDSAGENDSIPISIDYLSEIFISAIEFDFRNSPPEFQKLVMDALSNANGSRSSIEPDGLRLTIKQQTSVPTDTMGATSAAMLDAASSSSNTANQRLAGLRDGRAGGMATGDQITGGGATLWTRGFGRKVSQDDIGEVKGYSSTTFGGTIGADGALNEVTVLGSSFSVSSADIDGDGIGKSKVNVDTVQYSIYSEVKVSDFFMNGMAGYAWNDIETSRTIDLSTIGVQSTNAVGKYKGNTAMVAVGAGVPLNVSSGRLTPEVNFTYTSTSHNTYTETGAGDFNLKVQQEDVASGILALGAAFQTSTVTSDGLVITPNLRASVSYDVIGDKPKARAAVASSNVSSEFQGASLSRLGGSAGVGLMITSNNISLAANYDGALKQDFTSHTGKLKLSVGF